MKVLNLIPGSQEWLDERGNNFCASEAPEMMGVSPYKTRDKLLKQKKGWKVIVDDGYYKEMLREKGHETERKSRSLIEVELVQDFNPIVCVKTYNQIGYLASLDGITDDYSIIFEHKLWNKVIAENVQNEILEPLQYWQLEHQLFVSEADSVLFMTSDGTRENREYFYYTSIHERREELIHGWEQFEIDLDEYKLEANPSHVVLVAREIKSLPILDCTFKGTEIISNAAEMLPLIIERSKNEMSRSLDTDQDFADKDKFNKMVKIARQQLKDKMVEVKGKFKTLESLESAVKQIDVVLLELQSHGEKQVKTAKKEKIEKIIKTARDKLINHIDKSDKSMRNISVANIVSDRPDWDKAVKGLRSIASIENAVDKLLVEFKLKINDAVSKAQINLKYFKKYDDYLFLFHDLKTIILHDEEIFNTLIEARVSTHKAKQEEIVKRKVAEELAAKELAAKRKQEAKELKEKQEALAKEEQKRKKEARELAEKKIKESRELAAKQKKDAQDLKERQEADALAVKEAEPEKKKDFVEPTPDRSINKIAQRGGPQPISKIVEIIETEIKKRQEEPKKKSLKEDMTNWGVRNNINEIPLMELMAIVDVHSPK